MTPRTKPPFRADHVGSLLRPEPLLRARERFAAGEIDADELRGVEDEAIRDAVKLQEDVGLRSITDGEFRRAQWHMDFIYSLGGIGTIKDETHHVRFRNEAGTIEWAPPLLHVEERIHLDETIFADHFAFLKQQVGPGRTPKLTIPSPSMVHYRGGRASIDPAVYPDIEEFWRDLTAAYYRSSWVAEGGYDFVAEALFNELEVDGYFMEWDDARSGGFEPLRFVPKGKIVVLGLVTTKRHELEAKDDLKRRIEEASRYVDLDQLCLSPQCGFSTTVEGNAVTVEDEIAKLRLVVETADEVWGS